MKKIKIKNRFNIKRYLIIFKWENINNKMKKLEEEKKNIIEEKEKKEKKNVNSRW